MKLLKVFFILLALTGIFLIMGCGQTEEPATDTTTQETTTEAAPEVVTDTTATEEVAPEAVEGEEVTPETEAGEDEEAGH